tara:strand:+ start:3654 stop:4175 length:522 start_codon:yes stop_codon:yes gene_type:complete
MLFFRLSILIIPLCIITFFFILLTDDNSYPGADFDTYDMPQFELLDMKTNLITNEESLGDNFILNVWASWCITCLVEHPFLMELQNQNMNIIGLNYKDESADALSWIEKYGNPYNKIIQDYKGSLAMDLGVTGAPETFLVQNGKIVVRFQGEINSDIWRDVFVPLISSNNNLN